MTYIYFRQIHACGTHCGTKFSVAGSVQMLVNPVAIGQPADRLRYRKLPTNKVTATPRRVTKQNCMAVIVDPVFATIRLLMNGARVEPKPLINCR